MDLSDTESIVEESSSDTIPSADALGKLNAEMSAQNMISTPRRPGSKAFTHYFISSNRRYIMKVQGIESMLLTKGWSR